MTVDNKLFLNRIISELKEKYSCHSFILYGSRARGEHNEKSDWDLLAVRDSGEQFRDARVLDGAYLDTWVYSLADIKSVNEGFLRLRNGIVIEERDQIATDLLQKVSEFYKKGPKLLPDWERELIKTWNSKMLDRFNSNDAEGDFRLHWFLTDSLMNYFVLSGMWYLGPKESLAWLKTNRPQDFSTFEKAFKTYAQPSDWQNLLKLLEKIANKQA